MPIRHGLRLVAAGSAAALLLALGGCGNQPRPQELRAESTELRNNHARTVVAVAERDLRLRELARGDKANATLGELDKALVADLAEVDYLLKVYDDPKRAPEDGIEAASLRRLHGLHDDLQRAIAAAPLPAPAPTVAKPAAPAPVKPAPAKPAPKPKP